MGNIDPPDRNPRPTYSIGRVRINIRVRVRTHEPTPECVCELDVHPIRVRRSPPRTEDVLYGVECGMRPLTSESHRRSYHVNEKKSE
jgi:hypothetical protein